MKSFIKAVSYYIPEKKLTNEELAVLFPEWSAEAIFEKTGIKWRGVTAEGELSSDIAVKAAEKVFESYPEDRSEIDFLIFCSQTPDYISPSTACLIQDRLGLKTSVGALDVSLACTGYVYSLSLAKGLIESGVAKNVLLLTGETLTKGIYPKDKSMRVLFGDAGTATLIGSRENIGIGNFVFGTDGSRADWMMIKAGGFRNPIKENFSYPELEDEFGNIYSDRHAHMEGPNVLSFSLEVASKTVRELLALTSNSLEEIDYFIFHQANLFLLQTLRKQIRIPEEKFCINLMYTGNTVSNSVPIALSDSISKGNVKAGDRVMLVAFGVGLSWSATIINV